MALIPKKAVALVSGGADSQLAIHLIRRQEIEVLAIHFNICRFNTRSKEYQSKLENFFTQLGIALRTVMLEEEYLRMLASPKFGYGRGFNPCIDCHILMLQKAKEIMKEVGAGFVVTGEVVGQRPMSQNIPTLRLIELESVLRGWLLRPLSAKLLPPTLPELTRIVDRTQLLGISGRSRKPQITLAQELGLPALPGSAGGCLLTEKQFANKVGDLFQHAHPGIPVVNDVELLHHGRHFRFPSGFKVVVGKNHDDNLAIVALAREGDLVFTPPPEIKGPIALVRGAVNERDRRSVASLLLSYCDIGVEQKGRVLIESEKGEVIGDLTAGVLPRSEAAKHRL